MDSHFLGFDLSTQQLKAIIISSHLQVLHEATVSFDTDLLHHGVHKGVISNPVTGEVCAPVAMFLDAIDLVLSRLNEQGAAFSKVQGISGAGMQHGPVFWNHDAERLLAGLTSEEALAPQLEGAFSHAFSPNWQDASTQKECEAFDAVLGGGRGLAEATGSAAHHRFSGPQIQRFRQKHPDRYTATSRIGLVSSFLASVFLGTIAPIDISDVCGANLWDIQRACWHDDLLSLAAGGPSQRADLQAKLGLVHVDGGASLGNISPYFVARYGFPLSSQVMASTGDNPATMLALPLRASDAIVSLGTSTTFLMATNQYQPDPAYHLMNHPTTPGTYMLMLCYKNGGLARERVRDHINRAAGTQDGTSWTSFNDAATATPTLGRWQPSDTAKIGLYMPRPEIVPLVPAGTWRFTWRDHVLTPVQPTDNTSSWRVPHDDARAMLESQLLSLRLRAAPLFSSSPSTRAPAQPSPPPQPRRIYLVGGGAVNPAIAALTGQILGGTEGVYKLEMGGNACALGAAYKAAWGAQRRDAEGFEDWLEGRWEGGGFARKIGDGYEKGVWEGYEEGVRALGEAERWILGERE